jgi:ABC-type multidrug transport system fused ATPase/permease subunit
MMLSFLLHNKLLLFASILINMLSGFTRTIGASYLEKLSDMIGQKTFENFINVMLAGAFIMFSAYVLRSIGADICIFLNEKLALHIRLKIFDKITRMDFFTFEKYKKGDLQSVFRNDVNAASYVLYIIFSRILNNVFLFAFSVWYMMTIDVNFTIIIVLCIIIFGVLNQYILNKVKKYQIMVQKGLGDITSVFESGFTAIELIKSYGAKEYIVSLFNQNREKYNKNSMKTEIIRALRLVVYNLSSMIAFFGSMIYLGYKGINGDISIGQVLVYIYMIKQILVPVEVIFRWMMEIARGRVSWDRVYQIIDLPEEKYDKILKDKTVETNILPKQPCPVRSAAGLVDSLVVSGINYSYEADKKILDNVSFNMKKGDIIKIAGKSGSGKTTLIKILLGLYSSPSAVIQVNYKAVKSLWGTSSYASSSDTLFPLSIYENIALGNERIKKEECRTLLYRLGFGEWIDTLPKGIDTVLKSNELSGGQQQVIINARALLAEFPIVVLDEPFSALDQGKEKLFTEELMRRKESRLIILISHRQQTIGCEDKTMHIV